MSGGTRSEGAGGEPALVRGLDGVWTRARLDTRTQAALFARLILGGAPPGSLLHVWAARRRADGRLLAFRRDPLAFVSEPGALVTQALAWHRRGLEVFAGVLPRTVARLDNGAVGNGALVWADVDEPNELARLDSFCAAQPAHYMASSGGGGRHAAWLLDRPQPAALLAEACRRLAVEVGGDLAVCHPGASLRLPGTRNRKPGRGWCELLVADLARPGYDLAELVGELPDDARRARDPNREGRGALRAPAATPPSRDPLHRIAPPVYVRALCGVDVPDGGGWISCPLPGHTDAHPSCLVHADPARGWRCFSHPGGPVGGRIYDLASALAGGPTGRALRGEAFREARQLVEATVTSPSGAARS